jgi:hypothetical protein
MEKRGIKETLDVIEALEKVTLDILKAISDGISFDDINVIFANMGPLKNAVEGISEIDDEMKDLDIQEIKALLDRATNLAFNLVDGVKEFKRIKSA